MDAKELLKKELREALMDPELYKKFKVTRDRPVRTSCRQSSRGIMQQNSDVKRTIKCMGTEVDATKDTDGTNFGMEHEKDSSRATATTVISAINSQIGPLLLNENISNNSKILKPKPTAPLTRKIQIVSNESIHKSCENPNFVFRPISPAGQQQEAQRASPKSPKGGLLTFKDLMDRNEHKAYEGEENRVTAGNCNIYKQILAAAKENRKSSFKMPTRSDVEYPCSLDTNLTYNVHQSLQNSIPQYTEGKLRKILMHIANSDETSLDTQMQDLEHQSQSIEILPSLSSEGKFDVDHRGCVSKEAVACDLGQPSAVFSKPNYPASDAIPNNHDEYFKDEKDILPGISAEDKFDADQCASVSKEASAHDLVQPSAVVSDSGNTVSDAIPNNHDEDFKEDKDILPGISTEDKVDADLFASVSKEASAHDLVQPSAVVSDPGSTVPDAIPNNHGDDVTEDKEILHGISTEDKFDADQCASVSKKASAHDLVQPSVVVNGPINITGGAISVYNLGQLPSVMSKQNVSFFEALPNSHGDSSTQEQEPCGLHTTVTSNGESCEIASKEESAHTMDQPSTDLSESNKTIFDDIYSKNSDKTTPEEEIPCDLSHPTATAYNTERCLGVTMDEASHKLYLSSTVLNEAIPNNHGDSTKQDQEIPSDHSTVAKYSAVCEDFATGAHTHDLGHPSAVVGDTSIIFDDTPNSYSNISPNNEAMQSDQARAAQYESNAYVKGSSGCNKSSGLINNPSRNEDGDEKVSSNISEDSSIGEDDMLNEVYQSCLAKEMRPKYISKNYLKNLANARKTAEEIKARKPEPRVKLDKPCRLDTNLTYAVRQSLKRSLPLIAGKNKLSALMVMADGMFDEMSLDRDLDDLAWPYDPLAELRKSGLAMVDYMDPGPAESAIINTSDTKDQSSPSGSVQCSATVQALSDLNNGDPENNRNDDSVETFKLADSLNLTPVGSSDQPANVSVSDAGAAGQIVPSSPKLETVSSVSKESFQSAETLRLLFKPLKSIVDSLFDRDSSRVLVNQMQSPPTYEISKIKLLPSGYENTRQTSFVQLSDEPYKLHVSVRDETDFNNANAISDYSTNEARLSDFSVDPYKRKKLFESLDLVRGIRPQFLGKFYLERLANTRKTAAEIKARKPESRVKTEKPCRLDTNLTHAVHQSLKRSLPLIAGKKKLSALIVMADGMFDKMSLDRDLNHLAWPNDPLAELKASGLATIDYARPFTSEDVLRTAATVDPKDETTPVEISSSSIGKYLLPENSESKDVDISDIVNCPSQLHQVKVGTPEEHWSPKTNLQPTSFDQGAARRTPFRYPQVPSPPRTDTVLSNDTSENHQDCLDSVEGSQISLSSSDFIKTDDFTAGMLPLETTPSMRKEDDHHSVDSALGEETSATIFDKDGFESEVITICTRANTHQHDREKGLGVFFKSLSSPSIGENEDLSSTVVGTVSSNVHLFEQLALDGRESSLKSSKLESSEFPRITTSCKAVKERALAFENFDICCPPSSAKPSMHRTEDNSLYTVNIKAQVAMFEKLLNANTSS